MTTHRRGPAAAVTVLLMGGWAAPHPQEVAALLSDAQQYVDQNGPGPAVLLTTQLLLAALSLWTAVACLAVSLAATGDGTLVARAGLAVIPPVLRPVLAGLLGVGVLALSGCATPTPAGTLPPAAAAAVESITTTPATQGSTSEPAAADSTGPASKVPDFDWPTADPPHDQAPPDPSPTPELPTESPADAETPVGPDQPAGQTPDTSHYVVAGGDCLWHIASAHLPGASTAELVDAVQALWLANESLIGDDPDHIVPGQTLVLPPALMGSPS